ncbi:restriction endonuclease subunit S [Enterovibrio paralichthyis]|uniref:restriction endonuclease subunit S n=1 Tax=Enterovibrio paralichthyis TaxID=2853805 RepID=UPI001C496989|nr:restriction endonuclease subunit S [Enterovibrio paralichthyis]MBV7297284.1 restriction endonuclease subunit S [Enterovibrio paralichthyis]
MSAEKLITDHIDIWTSAVQSKSASGRGSSKKRELYGIKKLRELILELAVRGKLVPQDPTDEPASVLLERITAEMAELVKQKKIKRQKSLPPIRDEEKPFSLSQGWEWARLGMLFDIVYGKGMPNSKLTEEGYDVFGANGIIGKYTSYLYEEAQLLVSCRGAYSGKPNISPKFCFVTSNSLVMQSTWKHLVLRYFYYSLTIADKEKIVTGSAQPQVTAANLEPFLIAVPPLPEQHRIVAKVDELMALCDQLEQQTEASLDAHQVLVETLLATLTNSQNATELMANWARISEHFYTLFTTEQSIDQLKQTILQLAVMGKLVPQDPNDEPATKLLERIAEEKAQLVKEKKIKKQKALPPIAEDEKPFELPKGWEWIQCADAARPETTITYGILKPVWKDKGVPTARIKDMVNGSLELRNIVYCCPERASKFDKTTLVEGDLLIAKDGATLGKTAFVPPELVGGNITQHVLRFSISPFLNREFVRLIIDSPIGQSFMKGETKGVALPGVNVGDFRKMPLALPPLAEQQLIVEKVETLLSICNELQQCLRDSQQTQLLLTDAIVEQAL